MPLPAYDPAKYDPEVYATWPSNHVHRRITIECYLGGGFAVREEERHNLGMGWDEMLGHVAVMTMPEALKTRCHIYPMTTDEEDAQREVRLQEMREETELRRLAQLKELNDATGAV